MSWQPFPSPGLDYFYCIPGHSWAASLTALSSTSFVKGKLGNGPTDGFMFLALQDAQKQKLSLSSAKCSDRVQSRLDLTVPHRENYTQLKQGIQEEAGPPVRERAVGRSGPLHSHPGSITYYLLSLSSLFSKVGIHSGFVEQLQLRRCSWDLALRKDIQ